MITVRDGERQEVMELTPPIHHGSLNRILIHPVFLTFVLQGEEEEKRKWHEREEAGKKRNNERKTLNLDMGKKGKRV